MQSVCIEKIFIKKHIENEINKKLFLKCYLFCKLQCLFKTMKKKDYVLFENNNLEVFLNCNFFQKDNFFIGFVPSLKITSKSVISENDAFLQLKSILIKYFELVAINKESLNAELQRLGWDNFNPPLVVSVPSELFYNDFHFQDLRLSLPLVA